MQGRGDLINEEQMRRKHKSKAIATNNGRDKRVILEE